MKKILSFLLLLSASGTINSQSITRLLAVSKSSNDLLILDTNNYATVATKTLAFAGGGQNIVGFNGLAKHPVSGQLFVVARTSTSRYLGILNPATGSITTLGNLNDNFAQITFNANNTLLGVTGDGANAPETVFRIDQNTALTTLLSPLGNGADGEVIAFNPANNKVYHWSGNGTVVYESFDTTFTAPSNIPVGSYSGETFSAVYKSAGNFLISNIDEELIIVDTLGNFSAAVGITSSSIKGLAYITCPRSIIGVPTICGGAPASLTMSAVGTDYQWYLNGVAIANATTQAINTTTAGNYNCMVSDGCGTDSTGVGVNVITGSLPIVTISGSSIVCSGQTTSLIGSSGGTSQWYQNGVLIPSATSNTYVVSAPGIYNMIKTNSNGCKDSASVGKTVSLSPSPTIGVTGTMTLICAGQQLTLTASGANTYSWSTGDQTSTVITTPSITTSYTVTGVSSASCSSTYTLSQAVSPCTDISEIHTKNSLIKIYPNPSQGFILIESTNLISNYEIMNISGQTLIRNSFYQNTIDLQNLSNGIYFLNISDVKGNQTKHKIVLSK